MNHSSNQIDLLLQTLTELPENKQHAVRWLIANYAAAVSICKAKPLTESQRKQYEEDAIRKDDMHLLVLVLLERIINSD